MKITVKTLPCILASLAILLLCNLCQSTYASDSLTHLAQSATWHKLMLYESDNQSFSGVRSAIHSPEFFLAKDGDINPEAELEATITALTSPSQTGQNDQHPKCRFPARLIWLREVLSKKNEQLQPISCPEFSAWSDLEKLESISLVFANGFLENPASYFGHTFLKFNRQENIEASNLSDTTLNFGAILDKKDDPITYIFKGITGGYDGGFSPIEFYFHTSTYGEKELRDLWEYRLNLPKPAVQMIAAHAWEVMQKKYVYYFFKKNCAYRIAELIQIIDNIPALSEKTPWLIPQKMVQHLAKIQYKSKPLVSNIIYHPSRQSRLYEKFSNLTREEISLLRNLQHTTTTLNNPELNELPLERKQAIVDTLIDYHQFSATKKQGKSNNKKTSPLYLSALAARLALPEGIPSIASRQNTSPDQGRPPSWIQIEVASTSGRGQNQNLRLRPAYYDNLDASSAQVKNGALSMGDIQISHQKGKYSLRQFDLIAIDSVNPAVTGLPGDQGFGWKLKAGLEPAYPSCQDCTISRLQGDIGLGLQLSPTWFFSAYSGGGIQESYQSYGNAFARVSSTLLIRPTESLSMRARLEWRKSITSNLATERISSIESRLALGANKDLRLLWEHDNRQRLGLGIGHYW